MNKPQFNTFAKKNIISLGSISQVFDKKQSTQLPVISLLFIIPIDVDISPQYANGNHQLYGVSSYQR